MVAMQYLHRHQTLEGGKVSQKFRSNERYSELSNPRVILEQTTLQMLQQFSNGKMNTEFEY